MTYHKNPIWNLTVKQKPVIASSKCCLSCPSKTGGHGYVQKRRVAPSWSAHSCWKKNHRKRILAQRRGQEKLDKLNLKMKEDGITPKETRYQTEKQFLRDAIDDAASTAQSPEEFSKILDENITSSSRSVETDTAIFTLAEKNLSLEELLGPDTQKIFSWKHLKKTRNPVENWKKKFWNSRLRILPQIYHLFLSLILLLILHIIFIKSNLRLVIDLQTCIKAQQSKAYAQKVKLTNLKQMAQTVATYKSMDMILLMISMQHSIRHQTRPVLPENL